VSDGPHWTVWRQDDNGIRAEVARFADEEPARALAAELEARGHKQIYWVTEPPAGQANRRP
jgi:hypothetical protein